MSWNINRVRTAWETHEAARVKAMGLATPSKEPSLSVAADESYRRRRWIRDMFNDFLIVADDFEDGALYRVDFEVSDTAVTFSEPVAVRVSYEPARAATGLTKVLLSRDDSLLGTDEGDARRSLYTGNTARVELSAKPFPGAAAPFGKKGSKSDDPGDETLESEVEALLKDGKKILAGEISVLAKKFDVDEDAVKAAIAKAQGKISLSALDWGNVDEEIIRLTSL